MQIITIIYINAIKYLIILENWKIRIRETASSIKDCLTLIKESTNGIIEESEFEMELRSQEKFKIQREINSISLSVSDYNKSVDEYNRSDLWNLCDNGIFLLIF